MPYRSMKRFRIDPSLRKKEIDAHDVVADAFQVPLSGSDDRIINVVGIFSLISSRGDRDIKAVVVRRLRFLHNQPFACCSNDADSHDDDGDDDDDDDDDVQ